MKLFFKLALGLCAVDFAFSGTVLYQLPIVNAPTSADGFERVYVLPPPSLYPLRVDIDVSFDPTSGVLANGTFPGPTLKFTKGDRAQVSKQTPHAVILSRAFSPNSVDTGHFEIGAS